MTTRAGRALKTLHDRIERLKTINKELLKACKLTITYLEDGAPYTALARLKQAIDRAENK